MNFFNWLLKRQTAEDSKTIDPGMKYLIVGLGNIGPEYENTRHNIGFWVLDELIDGTDSRFSLERHAFRTELRFKGKTLILIKPTTYMNLSGKALRYWMDKEKIGIENVLVVVDDIALPTGTLRMKKNGSAGGHNGLTNIIETLGHDNFSRLRFGVGNNFRKGRQVDYVLGTWTKEEEDIIIPKLAIACEMVRSFVAIGIEKTMNAYNNK